MELIKGAILVGCLQEYIGTRGANEEDKYSFEFTLTTIEASGSENGSGDNFILQLGESKSRSWYIEVS
jgi:hypothetical protein